MKYLKKIRFVIPIAIILIFNIGLIVGVNLIDKQSERNTTELTVKVLGVKKYEDLERLVILTEEYENTFVLHGDLETLNVIENKLSDENVIKIRVRNIEKKDLGSAENINCVSLTREGEELFSLNDYNNNVSYIASFCRKVVIFIEVIQVAIVTFLIFKKKTGRKA